MVSKTTQCQQRIRNLITLLRNVHALQYLEVVALCVLSQDSYIDKSIRSCKSLCFTWSFQAERVDGEYKKIKCPREMCCMSVVYTNDQPQQPLTRRFVCVDSLALASQQYIKIGASHLINFTASPAQRSRSKQ